MQFDDLKTILEIGLALFGPACFFGWDQRYRLWRKQRAIARLQKQRAYYAQLATSDSAVRHFLFAQLFILAAIAFIALMFLGLYGSNTNQQAMRGVLTILGTAGYSVACFTLGRLHRIKIIDQYLARVDRDLQKLQQP
ncbi:hypothetical protein BBJ41_12900 [Burkholderia stabilis]|uniref:hypothetical protein n=1 Tax=Burkholderia stabilis TaxID=95485 RepID=UPI000851D4D7|nr:hypothetical protein [Burkholderia stabilis]AOR68348.1 hypothetical protein BBJ41_12900 [Burkholderia stabilis]HDR9495529.1 hypothetical protein [Burkholderia stabilis]HDR9526642.1 hypothetical protein [Burkholderia stabilis]HDR9534124.1 hypothetical protein [Burkholderia stabilis]HDR9540654.1 hypothetical protein [Burkholderia stabilis]